MLAIFLTRAIDNIMSILLKELAIAIIIVSNYESPFQSFKNFEVMLIRAFVCYSYVELTVIDNPTHKHAS